MVLADYFMLKGFEVMRVEKDGQMIERLVKTGTRLGFVTYEQLYEAIKEVHKHGAWMLIYLK